MCLQALCKWASAVSWPPRRWWEDPAVEGKGPDLRDRETPSRQQPDSALGRGRGGGVGTGLGFAGGGGGRLRRQGRSSTDKAEETRCDTRVSPVWFFSLARDVPGALG